MALERIWVPSGAGRETQWQIMSRCRLEEPGLIGEKYGWARVLGYIGVSY